MAFNWACSNSSVRNCNVHIIRVRSRIKNIMNESNLFLILTESLGMGIFVHTINLDAISVCAYTQSSENRL